MMMYVALYEDHIFPVFKRESIIIRTPITMGLFRLMQSTVKHTICFNVQDYVIPAVGVSTASL